MGVGWDPFFVMWCVLIKDGRLGHCVCDVLWKGGFRVNGGTARRIVFWIKGVPLSLSLDGTCCKNAKSSCRNTEVLLQKSKQPDSVQLLTLTWAVVLTVVMVFLPGQWQPHTWWGFVVLFVKKGTHSHLLLLHCSHLCSEEITSIFLDWRLFVRFQNNMSFNISHSLSLPFIYHTSENNFLPFIKTFIWWNHLNSHLSLLNVIPRNEAATNTYSTCYLPSIKALCIPTRFCPDDLVRIISNSMLGLFAVPLPNFFKASS